MARWLRTFIGRELVADVPAEMDSCLDCGKVECSESEFQSCVRRKARATLLVSQTTGRATVCAAESILRLVDRT
jgi:hypothetical protein